MLTRDLMTPRNIGDSQPINANLSNNSEFLGIRPSPTTLTPNQNFLSHKTYPIDQ
jgi:hypothetical protein